MLSRAATAVQRTMVRGVGMTVKRFFTAVLQGNLRRCTGGSGAGRGEPPWMAGFGALSDISDENQRVLEAIEVEFEGIQPEDNA